MKNLTLGDKINIFATIIGILGIIVTIITTYFSMFTGAVIGVIGIMIGLFFSRFLQRLTNQPWFSKKKNPRLLGREKEIQSLIGKIETGQSSIIVGIFSSERTAILDYLRKRNNSKQFIFSHLDIGPIAGNAKNQQEFGPVQFWEESLQKIGKINELQDEFNSYEESQQHDFEYFSLEQLFKQIDQKGYRLVLMINRFHKIVHLDKLNDPSFFASLRALGLHAHGPLSLILTISESEQLPKLRTLEAGKLYEFNFLNEINLGALSEKQTDDLLRKKGIRRKEECQWIKECSGGHPYLLQKAIKLLETHSKSFLYSLFFRNSFKPETMKDQFLEKIVERELLQKNLSTHPDMCNALFSVVEGKTNSIHSKALNELRRQGFLDKIDEQWKIRSLVIADFLSKKVQEKDQLCDTTVK
ncbi:AAA-like domain-containing protein [Candidatus Parabeggiatoa sp. HSG14]|uniref:AAA-like domain-containing protein n=1 Tax=Candidatus Parabeggiatoa sp. HSG14 TaxID=3055593 RepID=UPI0025A865E2|nr:AAA-like domain-containing protein [Thiotrichales bacterium HSG14]